MKSYPSIQHWSVEGRFGAPCYAFTKLDGTNIRLEYSHKRGWYKSGTKKMMIDDRHDTYGSAVSLFETKYEILGKIFKDNKFFRGSKNFVVFCEYFGENSFAGDHDPNDKMDIVLFDVWIMKKGFITPKDFIKIFENQVDIPSIIYKGTYNRQLVRNVQQNIFNLKEGVVVKGKLQNNRPAENVWMTKIKTDEWLERLKIEKGIGKYREELET